MLTENNCKSENFTVGKFIKDRRKNNIYKIYNN